MVHDVRSTIRGLIAQPGWTIATILCLAIATGSSTAAFSLVNGLLLRPLPFPHADRLVMVALKDRTQPTTRPFSLGEYRALARSSGNDVQLLARTFFPVSLRTASGSRMAEAEVVSGNYFDTLGVTPARGRFFSARDDQPNQPGVAVLSDRLWRARFDGDPNALVFALDSLTLAALCTILAGAAAVALYAPARSASRVNPAEILRSD